MLSPFVACLWNLKPLFLWIPREQAGAQGLAGHEHRSSARVLSCLSSSHSFPQRHVQPGGWPSLNGKGTVGVQNCFQLPEMRRNLSFAKTRAFGILRAVGDVMTALLTSVIMELQRGDCAATEWLHQKLSKFVLLWSRRYFLLSGFKSLYLGDDATFTFPPMHKSFPFPAWDSKQTLGVAFSTEPVQNVFHFLSILAELIQTQECVF